MFMEYGTLFLEIFLTKVESYAIFTFSCSRLKLVYDSNQEHGDIMHTNEDP